MHIPFVDQHNGSIQKELEVVRRIAEGAAEKQDAVVHITNERIEKCLESAAFWTEELPRYAHREQNKADLFAILAGLTSGLTGLAIWPILTGVSEGAITDVTVGSVLFSIAAFAAAVFALFPRVRNYGEMAGQARELTSRYGKVLGELEDLRFGNVRSDSLARKVVDEFEATKQKKDALRRLPDKVEVKIQRAQAERRLVEADAAVAIARKKAGQPAAS